MSSKEMERFWKQVSADPALKAALESGLPAEPTADLLAGFAQQHGFDVSVNEVREHQSASEELSEDALEAIAGGGDMPPQDPIDPVESPPEFPPEEEPPPEILPPGEGEIIPPEEPPIKK